jgi:hypothetical protein
LALVWPLLASPLLFPAAGVGVLVGVAVIDVPVVPVVLLLVVVEVPVAALLLEALEAPGTSPSWLSAEKMLSMNPIMPPPRSPPPSSPSWS